MTSVRVIPWQEGDPTPPLTMAFPRSFLVLTTVAVLPAITSFSTLFTSALMTSLTLRLPISGMMCRRIRPLSVTTVPGFFGRPPFPRIRPASRSTI